MHFKRFPVCKVVIPVLLGFGALCAVTTAQADSLRPGFNSTDFGPSDDGSTSATPLGFTANFFGATYTDVFVNNNGNLTFDAALGTFTPFDLSTNGTRIIAPFFGDVDTRGVGSNTMHYGSGIVDGHNAFGATWNGVGYFSSGTDKLNKFQTVLIDRSDTGVGNFDFEFNYDQMLWETGDDSGGTGGLGGSSARAGYSDGTLAHSLELPGAGVVGAYLDSNASTGLIHNSINSAVPGRYDFFVRSGGVQSVETPEPGSIALLAGMGLSGSVFLRRRRRNA